MSSAGDLIHEENLGRGKFPPLTSAQIKWLREAYPPRCIQEGQTELAAHRYAARYELVELLVRLSKDQFGDEDSTGVEV